MSDTPQVLALFRDAASSVPAYARFLHDNGIDPAAVDEASAIPLMTKAGYHQRYPLPDRCRGGRLDAAAVVALSSGSSGQPTVWPRSEPDELPVIARFEQVFRDGFRAAERSTLAVVCFALGNWVGGMYTVAACRKLAASGYRITVAAPGNDIDEILRVVEELGGHYDQTVLLGYPPFVKNIIDAGIARGVDWSAYDIKLVLAGEVFSEQWRDLVAGRAGIADPETAIAALYGTADAGVLGNETPLSVRIRRFLAERPDISSKVFGDSRLPTLVQYDPVARLFEAMPDGTLTFSADGTVPLVRYHIADEGGVLPFDEFMATCRDHGFDPGEGPDLPFVYVFGRSLFTVSFFGANVYPENITVGLERPEISGWTTGRFVLRTVDDANQDRRLSVVVELAPGAEASEQRRVLAAESIRAVLLRLNSEFAHYVPAAYRTPQVELRPADDPEFFPRGVKHRYTRPPVSS
ncbi:phenylacetate-CoA ligase [Actinoplanes lutulentus]|uniref:Phenylacetate-CoA ligase n=1 Tax=Actinoplanes lutulentus TaxID=1287878 RepID=A0A327ZJQ3_9ACTN|nr:phenylacetate--CoA ligase family protein [Actinoplanes lutulentus]MBB2940581.1 phenylacetate-CoA ligase [Actinoplanes lutulentus]RAK42893.1 phenylacetate-CoA ligase [Actinoplanes lutulentus]